MQIGVPLFPMHYTSVINCPAGYLGLGSSEDLRRYYSVQYLPTYLRYEYTVLRRLPPLTSVAWVGTYGGTGRPASTCPFHPYGFCGCQVQPSGTCCHQLFPDVAAMLQGRAHATCMDNLIQQLADRSPIPMVQYPPDSPKLQRSTTIRVGGCLFYAIILLCHSAIKPQMRAHNTGFPGRLQLC